MKSQRSGRMGIPKTGSSRSVPQPTRGDVGPVRTIAAHGQGLTCIMLPVCVQTKTKKHWIIKTHQKFAVTFK